MEHIVLRHDSSGPGRWRVGMREMRNGVPMGCWGLRKALAK